MRRVLGFMSRLGGFMMFMLIWEIRGLRLRRIRKRARGIEMGRWIQNDGLEWTRRWRVKGRTGREVGERGVYNTP
jgi:hypothetical protein